MAGLRKRGTQSSDPASVRLAILRGAIAAAMPSTGRNYCIGLQNVNYQRRQNHFAVRLRVIRFSAYRK